MFPDGTEFYLDSKDGTRGYNTDPARGADTFIPFSKHDVKTYGRAACSTNAYSASASITIPQGVTFGLLICVSTGWSSSMSQNTPVGTGIKSIKSTKHQVAINAPTSQYVSIYECYFNSGGTVTLSFGCSSHSGYATGQIILLA